MTGFEVYQMYLSLKLHFTRDDYDYFKFHGKTRASQASFEKRKDAYFFKKLASKYDHDRIEGYLVSNFISDSRDYITNIIKPSGETTYNRWKTKQENLINIFSGEVRILLSNIDSPYEENFETLFSCSKGKHPILLTSYLRKDISIETLIIFENCLGYVKRFSKVLTDPVWKEIQTQVIKYSPFLKIDCKRYKPIILKTVRENV